MDFLSPLLIPAAAHIRELEAENAALREARGVRVKPLVWLCHQDPKDTSEARTQVGSWTVWEINGSAYCYGPNDTCGKPCEGGLEAAKAAAQADYERRILAALEQAPVTVGEAWQPIETAPKDGQMILVCLPRMMNLIVRARFDTVHGYWLHDYEGEGGVSRYFSLHPGDVWMPMPKPPRALADAGEAG